MCSNHKLLKTLFEQKFSVFEKKREGIKITEELKMHVVLTSDITSKIAQ